MASPTTDKTGQIQPRTQDEQKPGEKMAALITKMTPELARALPKHLTADRLARITLTAIRVNPKLGECTQASFLGCILSCAMLGLEPNTPLGLVYLIPRKNNKNGGRLECSLLIGYQGMLQLGNNAGVSVFAYAVREVDEFSYELGLNPNIVHVPSGLADRESKPVTHAYAVSILPDNRRSFTVLTLAQIAARRARSGAADEGPWVTDFEAMCLKTAVRAHFKWMPKSTEKASGLAHGIGLEEAAEHGTPLLAAMDPAITDAMERQGIEVTGENIDQKTGEVLS